MNFLKKYYQDILLLKKKDLTLHRKCDKKVVANVRNLKNASLAQLARARDL